MSKLIDNSITIYEAIQSIKNRKYVMPAFQRQFVWSMGQIEKLWDSILLDYPIATFLFWHLDDSNVTWDTYFCDFLYTVRFDSRKSADSANYELIRIDLNDTDTAILDGQQRLTSLFLSLFGEAQIRPKNARKKTGEVTLTKLLIELDKHKVSTNEEEYNSKKFDIKFSDKIGITSPTQFEIKNIIEEQYLNKKTRENAIEEAIVNVPADSKDYARNILMKLCEKIFDEKLIRYTEITDMNQDDALEMFVRFNSGGKALSKSEITMSILEAYWPSARVEFGKILTGSYKNFDTDFIIRAALMLYGDVAKSNINKKIADDLKNDWSNFKIALANLDKLFEEMKIETSHFSRNWNVPLPILYYIYNNSDYRNNITAIRAYLLRAEFFIYFRSGTTGKLQEMKKHINNFNYEITLEMLEQIDALRVTDAKIEDILNSVKETRVAKEVLYYLSVEWTNKDFKYEHDHIHPFTSPKTTLISEQTWKKWLENRNRLSNLHLLEGRENASKNDMPLISYFNNMNNEQKAEFYEKAMLPTDISFEFKDFDDFYEARKKVLAEKIRYLLGYN